MIINKVFEKIVRYSEVGKSYLRGSTYGIRPGYIHKKNTEHFDDTTNRDEWQKEVYLTALEVFNTNSYKSVLDIGCGSAYKLRTVFENKEFTGVEIGTTLQFLKDTYPLDQWCTLGECKGQKYNLIVLSDVIEHVEDPYIFLLDIINNIPFDKIIISTPDRILLGGSMLGPPMNPTHFREWNQLEFKTFVSSLLTVEKQFISNHEQATQCIIASLKK